MFVYIYLWTQMKGLRTGFIWRPWGASFVSQLRLKAFCGNHYNQGKWAVLLLRLCALILVITIVYVNPKINMHGMKARMGRHHIFADTPICRYWPLPILPIVSAHPYMIIKHVLLAVAQSRRLLGALYCWVTVPARRSRRCRGRSSSRRCFFPSDHNKRLELCSESSNCQ